MTARTTLLPTDIDANGNVLVWDAGPAEGEADFEDWHDRNGDLPASILMHASDAKTAIAADGRYSLEPRDPQIRAEADAFVAQMQQDRADAAKRAEDAAAKAQLARDYVTAAATVAARRRAAAAAKPKAVAPATPTTPQAPAA